MEIALARAKNLLFCNSIISNPQTRGIYLQTSGFDSCVNIIGNVFLRGRNNTGSVDFIYTKPSSLEIIHLYLEDNLLLDVDDQDITPENQTALADIDQGDGKVEIKRERILSVLPHRFAPMSSKDVLSNVLANVGPWKRGDYEKTLVKRVLTRQDEILFDYASRSSLFMPPKNKYQIKESYIEFPDKPTKIANNEKHWINYDLFRQNERLNFQSD